ncbi:unnamed protein product [Closterium sp. Naga37s-1]|nr:unnamed protein product [Closterium sp. Naga37s-1]
MAPAALVGALRQGVCLSLNVGALERASTSACRSVGTRALAAAAASSVAADARGLEQGGARLSVRAASRAAPGGPLQEKSGGGGDSSEGAGIGRGRIAGWACIERCGACCQLDKGELAPPIETILRDPSELAVYRSMVGADGWCRHYDKGTRTCRIYDSRILVSIPMGSAAGSMRAPPAFPHP